MQTRAASNIQERDIAKHFGGRVTVNSGGTRFGGGDVLTADLFIEAKTSLVVKESFSIKEKWLEKAREQAFEQRRNYWTLAFRFAPYGQDFYIVDKKCMDLLLEKIEEEKNNDR